MSGSRETRYPGKLSKRFSPPADTVAHPAGTSLLDTGVAQKKEFGERLLLLCEYYGVDIESHELWYDLAVALANNHVPGFVSVRSGRGISAGVSICPGRF